MIKCNKERIKTMESHIDIDSDMLNKLDNVRDMLLGYCEVMDRVNEFYKLLW